MDTLKLRDAEGFTLLLKAASQDYFILVENLINQAIKVLGKQIKTTNENRDDKLFIRAKVKAALASWINAPTENH